MSARENDYDGVAYRYADEIRDELAGKPLDRALLRVVAEATGDGVAADLGAGPGHVAGHLRDLGVTTFGLDLSPVMSGLARGLFAVPAMVADLTRLPLADASLATAVCWYAVIHLDPAGRARAYAEIARVLRPGGLAVIAFHVADGETPVGGTRRVDDLFGVPVDLTFHFLDPDAEAGRLDGAGLRLQARLDRQADPAFEHASRRCYPLARRPA